MSGVPGTGAQYEDFLIDSGSTSHWASSLDMFTSFDYHETVFNLADNNQTVTSVGTGDIQFTTRTINDKLLKITIRGVHHCRYWHRRTRLASVLAPLTQTVQLP